MKNIGIKIAAVAFLALVPSVSLAGRGSSAEAIQAAVRSNSVDAITAELERAEGLMCTECVQTVTNLTEDSRYAVREVAAWWFAKRPALRDALAAQFSAELPSGDTIKVRNAADFLGRTKAYASLPQLRVAIGRADVGAEAKLAVVRAVGYMSHRGGNDVLTTAMADRDAGVRAAAVTAWRDMIDQTSALPVVALLGDTSSDVRARAASVVGAMRESSARATLEVLVVTDADPLVRRNAAWALGKLGNAASRAALQHAAADQSGLVRNFASVALASLR